MIKFKIAISIPFGGYPVREISGVPVSSKFTAFFLFDDHHDSDKKWLAELEIEIGELGTPSIIQASALAKHKTDQILFHHKWTPVKKIEPRHINFLGKNLNHLLALAVDYSAFPGNKTMTEEELVNYKKELLTSAKKRTLTPEFLREITKKNLAYKKEFKRLGKRNTSNEKLKGEYGVEVKTIQKWLAEDKKISAEKAGKKKAPTRKKGTK